MAELWRYQDRLAAGQLLPKRPRNELGNFAEGQSTLNIHNYQSTVDVPWYQSTVDVLRPGPAGYGRGDLRIDEREPRAFDYGLDYGKTGVNYSKTGVDYGNAGATFASVVSSGAEITGLADGTLLGAGVSGMPRAPTMGLSALEDPRISGVNSGLLKGASAGVSGMPRAPTMGLSALEDPRISGVDSGLLKGASAGLSRARSDTTSEQEFPEALSTLLSHPLASSSLFVEGLPIDCSRREVAHIFRRFRGYKDVRVHEKGKGSKKTGVLLCFVDFEDSFAAARALQALQGYKFDEDDLEAEPLRMQFSTRGPRSGPQPRRKRGR